MRRIEEIRFDLQLASNGSISVHCTSGLLPDEWADTVEAEQIRQIEHLRDRLGDHKITEGELVRLGLMLGLALIPAQLRSPFASLVASRGAAQLLRLRIVSHHLRLGALPWEYLRLPSQHDELGSTPLALDERFSIVRTPATGQPTTAAPIQQTADELRVLHASATEVAGFEALHGDDQAMDATLWGSSGRRIRRVTVDRLADPATRGSLEESLSSGPDLLVFTGHSTVIDGAPRLILADDRGHPDPLSGAELATMLVRAGTSMVVLNACDTATSDDATTSLAEILVRRGVETVVGMQMPITDSNAVHFAVGMVGSLGEGTTIDLAVHRGRKRVAERVGYAEWGIPTLVTSSIGDATDPTRGGTVSSGQRPAREPRASTRALIGGLAALVLLATGAGWWVSSRGHEGSGDPSVEVLAAGSATGATDTTATTTTTVDPNREFRVDGHVFHSGVFDSVPLVGGTLTDSSPTLFAILDRIEANDTIAVASSETRLIETGAEQAGFAGTPATFKYGGSNRRDSTQCRSLLMTNGTVTGVAGRIWVDDATGDGVSITAYRFADVRTALRFYWATSLFFGLRPEQCSGWPESSDALDPNNLVVTRMDFPLDGPAGELLTASGVEGTGLDPFINHASSALFRSELTMVVAIIGSKEPLDAQVVDQSLVSIMRAFAEG